MNFRHVIWDWNGTLFDDAWLCIDVMNGQLRARGLPPMPPERYRRIFGFPVRDYYRRLGFDFARESFEDLGNAFMVDYERRRLECGLRPGAREILEAVRAAGLSQSVLSAYRHDTLEELLAHFGLRGYFAGVYGGDDHFAEGKQAQGLRCLEDLGVAPSEALLVGDTIHDAEVAAAMGVACRLIPGGNQDRDRLAACGVPVEDSLDALRRVVAP